MLHKVNIYLGNCWYAYIFRQNTLSRADIPIAAPSSWEIYRASRQEWQCKGCSFVKQYQNCHCTFLPLFSPRSKILRLIQGPHLPGICRCQCKLMLWLVILPIMQCLPFTTRLRIGITAQTDNREVWKLLFWTDGIRYMWLWVAVAVGLLEMTVCRGTVWSGVVLLHKSTPCFHLLCIPLSRASAHFHCSVCAHGVRSVVP